MSEKTEVVKVRKLTKSASKPYDDEIGTCKTLDISEFNPLDEFQ